MADVRFPYTFPYTFSTAEPPDYTLEIDWDEDGFGTSEADHVTGHTLDVTYSRGRDQVSSLTGRSSAGKLKALLNNESDVYSPFNSSGALYGKLLPGKPVRLVDRNYAPAKALWTGRLKSIDPIPRPGGPNVARIEAVGNLGFIASREVLVEMQTSRRTDQAIGDVLDDTGWASGDRNLSEGQTTLTRWWADGKALDAIREIETAEGGFLKEDRNGDIAFEDRHYRMTTATSYTSQKTFSDAADAALTYTALEEVDPLPFIFNDFRAEVRQYTVGSVAVLWTLGETGTSSPLIPIGQSRTFYAQFPNPQSDTEALAVNAWTTLVENTDYEANSAADGSGTDLSGSLTVTLTKTSNQMAIAIANDHASLGAYITKLQARGTPVTGSDPALIIAEDSTSQTSFEKRTWPAPTPWIPDTAEALDWAVHNLSIYKDPIPLIKLSFVPRKDTTHKAALTDLDLSYRITLTANGKAGLGINEDFIIENMEHSIQATGQEVATLTLSPASSYSGFWSLSVGDKLGTSSRLAY